MFLASSAMVAVSTPPAEKLIVLARFKRSSRRSSARYLLNLESDFSAASFLLFLFLWERMELRPLNQELAMCKPLVDISKTEYYKFVKLKSAALLRIP
jgi:hypothetical protein